MHSNTGTGTTAPGKMAFSSIQFLQVLARYRLPFLKTEMNQKNPQRRPGISNFIG
jgi:hypothetical protein